MNSAIFVRLISVVVLFFQDFRRATLTQELFSRYDARISHLVYLVTVLFRAAVNRVEIHTFYAHACAYRRHLNSPAYEARAILPLPGVGLLARRDK